MTTLPQVNSVPDATLPQNGDLKVRERLLKAAEELFAQKGYSATSVKEIVAAAGVTKPILYYYFNNKEGIYIEILNDAYTRFDQLMDQAMTWQGDALAKIRWWIAGCFDLFMEKVDTARVIYMVYYGPPQSAPAYDYDRYRDRHLEVLQGFVEEGIQSGGLRGGNPLDITMIITGLLSVAMETQLCPGGPQMNADDLARTLELVFEGIANTKGN